MLPVLFLPFFPDLSLSRDLHRMVLIVKETEPFTSTLNLVLDPDGWVDPPPSPPAPPHVSLALDPSAVGAFDDASWLRKPARSPRRLF